MLLLALLLGCHGDVVDAPPQEVSVEDLSQELITRVTEDLGYDPTAIPDPSLPAGLIDDPEVGPYLQGALDILQAERDAWRLELPTLSVVARGWESCSGWKEEERASFGGVTSLVYSTMCGDLKVTHSTMSSTITTTTELRLDGTDDDGVVFDDYVLVSTLVAFSDGDIGVMSFGEQNPPDPGPSWQTTLALQDIGGGVAISSYTSMGYVYDALLGDYRPWHSTTITDLPDGSATISISVWSVIRQELVLWVVYIEASDGSCERITYDDDGNVSGIGSC